MATATEKKEDKKQEQKEVEKKDKKQEKNQDDSKQKRNEENKEMIKKLDELQTTHSEEPRASAAARFESKSGNNPTPPEERTQAESFATTASSSVGGAIAGAKAILEREIETQKRIESDPRYERDQKIFELAQTGKLSLVAPSEAEKAATLARSGLSEEAQEKIPKTAEEQVAEDMERLNAAEKKAADMTSARTAGEQEGGEPKNNLEQYKKEGKNVGDRSPDSSNTKTDDGKHVVK